LKSQRIAELKWGGLPVGGSLGEISPVFPRLDKKALLDKLFQTTAGGAPVEQAVTENMSATRKDNNIGSARPAAALGVVGDSKSAGLSAANKITIDEFAKVELRVGQVVSAEKVQGADKLLKLIVDLGTETRQILAGIAKVYTAESLVGRKVVIVANLEPRKLRGMESNGMLLAASVGDEGRPVLATFTEEVPNGAKLR
jgi:methionyl-tRNA synthetase